MSSYRFIQLDVFTEEPFAGNPLAVFPEAKGLTDDEMMKIAREMNLSETVFVFEAGEESKQQKAEDRDVRGRRIRNFRHASEIARDRISSASPADLHAGARDSFRGSSRLSARGTL